MKSLLVFVLGGFTSAVLAAQSGYLHKLPAGSRLILAQPVEIPAHTATVYFQGGRVVTPADLDEYYPHCLLLSRVVAERVQSVPGGEFLVRRAYPYSEQHSRAGSGPVRVAGFGFTVGDGAGDGGSTVYYFTTRLELSSDTFPDVLHFECRHLSDYAIGRHIRLDEFARAVGSLWRVDPPAAVGR